MKPKKKKEQLDSQLSLLILVQVYVFPLNSYISSSNKSFKNCYNLHSISWWLLILNLYFECIYQDFFSSARKFSRVFTGDFSVGVAECLTY